MHMAVVARENAEDTIRFREATISRSTRVERLYQVFAFLYVVVRCRYNMIVAHFIGIVLKNLYLAIGTKNVRCFVCVLPKEVYLRNCVTKRTASELTMSPCPVSS